MFQEYALLFQGQAFFIEYNSGTSAEGLHSKSKVNRLPFFYQVLIMLYCEMLLNCLALLFYLKNLDLFSTLYNNENATFRKTAWFSSEMVTSFTV